MSVHQQIMVGMKEMAAQFAKSGVELDLPPPSNQTLGTEYIAFDNDKSLTAKFKFDPKFANPLKLFQGGFLSAAFDEVFGPLTYMAAKRPVVALELSTTFLRPFTAADEWIEIKAEVISKTKTVMVLKAEAKNKAGKLIAVSTNHSIIVSDANLAKTKG